MSTNQKESEPLYCRNNCGFFGHSRFDNYCSKCYNELFGSKQSESKDKSFYEEESKGGNIPTPSQPISINKSQKIGKNVSASLPTHTPSPSSLQESPLSKKFHRICNAVGCKKKLSLTSVECKCGLTFCSSHRYAEQHDCQYDYKKNKEELLSKSNPVVAPSKINEI